VYGCILKQLTAKIVLDFEMKNDLGFINNCGGKPDIFLGV
jgi:hypothetical protein